MHKKNLVCGVLIVSLLISNISFSMNTLVMNTLIWRGAKLIGKGTLPVVAVFVSYWKMKERDKLSQAIDSSNGDLELVVDAINNVHPYLEKVNR